MEFQPHHALPSARIRRFDIDAGSSLDTPTVAINMEGVGLWPL
jgi:hypothetical protein